MECSRQALQSIQNGEASLGDPNSLQAYPQNGNSPDPEDWDGQQVIFLTGPRNQDVQRIHPGPASQRSHSPKDFTPGLMLCYYYLEILNNFFNTGVRIFILHWAPQITWPILDIHTLVENSHCINMHIIKAKGQKNLLLTQAKKTIIQIIEIPTLTNSERKMQLLSLIANPRPPSNVLHSKLSLINYWLLPRRSARTPVIMLNSRDSLVLPYLPSWTLRG